MTNTGRPAPHAVSKWLLTATRVGRRVDEVRGCDLFDMDENGKVRRKDSYRKIVDDGRHAELHIRVLRIPRLGTDACPQPMPSAWRTGTSASGGSMPNTSCPRVVRYPKSTLWNPGTA